MEKQKTPYKGIADKRILQGKILVGEVKEKELNAYLKTLPDVAANGQEVEIDMDLRRGAKAAKKKDQPANEPV